MTTQLDFVSKGTLFDVKHLIIRHLCPAASTKIFDQSSTKNYDLKVKNVHKHGNSVPSNILFITFDKLFIICFID